VNKITTALDPASSMCGIEALLDLVDGRSFFFASTYRSLLCGGLRAVPANHTNRLVVGALPFDASNDAFLLAPSWQYEAAQSAVAARPMAPLPLRIVGDQPTRYRDQVREALALIEASALRKVVLSRCLDIEVDGTPDLPAVLSRMLAVNGAGMTFAAPDGEGGVLIGASPELLVRREGLRITSNPLAGSLPRAADPVEDAEQRAALLRSAKDRREHALVVEAVTDILRPYCTALQVPAEPSAIATPTVWHLSTRITGTLADPTVTALQLARALHPTPAVCGTPREAAQRAIAAIEGRSRGLYAGLVGWCDANGDGEWAVTLRCAEIRGRRLRLHAGAGIVLGSDPTAELAETDAKFRTMLAVLGLAEAVS